MSATGRHKPDVSRVFDTAMGRVGLAWTGSGLTRLRLDAVARTRSSQPSANVPPADAPVFIGELLDLLTTYASGGRTDFGSIPVEVGELGDFDRQVYGLARQIGWGETTTYGDLAVKLGSIQLARAVGQSMGRNPVPIVVPCHRVLAKGRRIGGFSAPGGARTKEFLLGLEGVAPASSAPLLAFSGQDGFGTSGVGPADDHP
jgi:methylated-DNA-[protein]-cysteine S-methyltransferase